MLRCDPGVLLEHPARWVDDSGYSRQAIVITCGVSPWRVSSVLIPDLHGAAALDPFFATCLTGAGDLDVDSVCTSHPDHPFQLLVVRMMELRGLDVVGMDTRMRVLVSPEIPGVGRSLPLTGRPLMHTR